MVGILEVGKGESTHLWVPHVAIVSGSHGTKISESELFSKSSQEGVYATTRYKVCWRLLWRF